jgi:FG-GAP-like repeat
MNAARCLLTCLLAMLLGACVEITPGGGGDAGASALSDIWTPDFDGFVRDAVALDLTPLPDRWIPTDVPRCRASTTESCICRDGRAGVQVCNAMGNYDACLCTGGPPPPGALPPRLLRPFSGLRSMTQRPTFRWVLPDDVTRARVEVCGDRACTRRITQAEVSGSSWRPAETLPPGVVFWHVTGLGESGETVWTSATWEVGIRHRDTPVDSAWGPLKDFNGDGLDDVAMFIQEQSQIQVWVGDRDRTLRYATTLDGEGQRSFGSRTAFGDIDGDGLADFVASGVGENGRDLAVFWGRRGAVPFMRGVNVVGAVSGSGADSVTLAIEDINGDGFGDLTVFSPTRIVDGSAFRAYLGGPAGLLSAPFVQAVDTSSTAEGRGVARGVGDINGDGYGDVVRVQRRVSTIFFGQPMDMGWRVLAQSVAPLMNVTAAEGVTGACAIDLNSDGSAELVVGFPRSLMRFTGSELLVVQSVDSGFPGVGSLEPALEYAKSRVACPGDLNGDGRPDLLEIRHCVTSESGPTCLGDELSLFHADDNVFAPVAMPRLRYPATPSLGSPTTAAGLPGDLDGDGYDDMVIVRGAGVLTLSENPGASQEPVARAMPDAAVAHSETNPVQ